MAIEPDYAVKAGGALLVQLGATLHNINGYEMWRRQRFIAELERQLLRRGEFVEMRVSEMPFGRVESQPHIRPDSSAG